MRTQSTTDSDTMSFRGASLDEAVALAEESLGAPVRVVAANRIRRGGIGGFFAADLGVEVSVSLDDETIEQALERLVSETAADERTRWMEHRDRDQPAPLSTRTTSSSALAAPRDLATSEAPRRNGLATPKPAEPMPTPALAAPSTVRVAQRDAAPSMVPVAQILDELAYLTTRPDREAAAEAEAGTPPAVAPLAVPTPITTPRTVALPTLPPRASEVARAASANAAVSQAHAVADERDLAAAHRAAAIDAVPFRPVLPEVRATDPATDPGDRSGDATHLEVELVDDEVDVTTEGSTVGAPSQRQVELAVAAADQLIESLQRETGVKRMSVKVVLRTGDQSAVEAAAEWEAS
jgi:hypothetical protein